MSAPGWSRGAAALGLAGALGCSRPAVDTGAVDAGPARARPAPAAPGMPTMPDHSAKPDEARSRTDLAAVRARIREYQMLNDGQHPPNLEVLQVRLSFPGDIVYDPSSGTAASRTNPRF